MEKFTNEIENKNKGGNGMNMRRLRSVNEAFAEIKAYDEHTAITKHLIRRLATENKVKTLHHGNRMLIDMDDLIGKFNAMENM